MGGDNGAADSAVGRHGVQLPPGKADNGQRRHKVGSMTSPEFLEQSCEHSSSNLPQLPLPYSPSGFNHQVHPPRLYYHLLSCLQALSDFLFVFIPISESMHLGYVYPCH